MINIDLKSYLICIGPSIALMMLFVSVNISYYQVMYGKKMYRYLARTVLLNTLAILIGWFPMVLFWTELAVKTVMPISCIFGAIACVGSRFIYTEIIPSQLAEQIVKLIKRDIEKKS
tara:strand:- start:215 stop:565 length:351 start_codon:yes stop_codon:yes gene_type:complete